MNITLYTLTDNGVPMAKAVRLFQAMARYIQPHHVQLHRPVVLKNKLTTTTVTMRAFKIHEIEKLVEDRLITPKRSLMSNWCDWYRLIQALKIKESK